MRGSKHWLGFEYCKPSESGLASGATEVGKRLGRLLSALGQEVTEWVVERGELTEELRDLRLRLIDKLKADGWIIRAKDGGGYSVSHPATEADRSVLVAAAERAQESAKGQEAYEALVKQVIRKPKGE